MHSAVDKLRGGKIILDGKELKRAEVELERLSSRRVKMHVGLVRSQATNQADGRSCWFRCDETCSNKNWRSLFEKSGDRERRVLCVLTPAEVDAMLLGR